MRPASRRPETLTSSTVLLLAFACLLLAVPSGSATADGVRAMNLDGSTPRVIPAAAFQADGSSMTYGFFFAGGYVHPLGGDVCIMAPVYLPNGYIVNAFDGLLFDNAAIGDIPLSLRRKNLNDTSSSEIMASVSTQGAMNMVQQLSTNQVSERVINNSGFSYSVVTCMTDVGSNHRLYAARIFAYPQHIFSNGFE